MTNPRIQLDDALKQALLDPDKMPESVEIKAISYVLHTPIKAGHKGAVWRVSDDRGRHRAVKFAIYEDYVDRSFLSEFYRAAKLENYPEFTRFIDAEYKEVNVVGYGELPFICFVEDWVDGLTLDDYLNSEQHLPSSFLLAFVRGMCEVLSALKANDLRHDDLHSGNVMLQIPAVGSLSNSYRIKIIDMGSLKPMTTPTAKEKDDHRHFVDHLVAIHNSIRRKKLLPIRDQRFLKECIALFKSMLDDDPSIALRSPDQIASAFALADMRSSQQGTENVPSLQSPFEYISAEHIADDRLLVKIFAESCPWLDKVAGVDPCLITGPRGCGKSTIFRWLSLRAHLHKPSTDIEQFRIAGFYISCSSDLQNRLSWIKTQAQAEKKFNREIVHYFNLLLAREVVLTLTLITRRDDRVSYWGFGKIHEQKLNRFLKDILQSSHVPVQGVSQIQQALEMLEFEMFRCHVQMLKGLNLEWTTPETFLGDFTTLLTKEIQFFRERRIAFLLDDFSTHRLPAPVQIVLNRIIWERRDSHIFKLSSEKYGAVLTDSFDATADVTREMVEIDCGREYIALDDNDQTEKARTFAVDLLAHRLSAAGYDGTPEELLGHSEWQEGSLGRALREKNQRTQGRTDNQYHGIECIADLCSGDVSTLLLLYRRIFEKGGVTQISRDGISHHLQHEAIESVSRELYDAIRHHYPYGPRMHSIVREFGTLVRRILVEGRALRQGSNLVPPQCPRIEIEQDHVANEEGLSEDQKGLERELVRRAVFIEMEPGRSRHKSITTLRWQLRRVYLPAFGAALSKNDAIKWKPSDFKFFLVNPSEACETEWKKRRKEDGPQGDLFQ